MPEISRFLGIVIAILDEEHSPAPCHAASGLFAHVAVIAALRAVAWPTRADFTPESSLTQVNRLA